MTPHSTVSIANSAAPDADMGDDVSVWLLIAEQR